MRLAELHDRKLARVFFQCPIPAAEIEGDRYLVGRDLFEQIGDPRMHV